MKTFVKVVLITGSVLLLLGLVLALSGLALGGNPYVVVDRLDGMGLVRGFGPHDLQYDWYNDNYDWDYGRGTNPPAAGDGNAADDGGTALPEAATDPLPLAPSNSAITRLEFEIGAGEVEIISGDDFALIYGGGRSRDYFYEHHEGSTWYIGTNDDDWRWWRGWWRVDDNFSLTVVLPRDFVAEYASISLGAGSMAVEQLAAAELVLDMGAGSITMGDIRANSADLHVGLGEMQVKRFHADTARLDVGMGSVRAQLRHELEQYRYRAAVGLGSVTVGRNSYSGNADVASGAADAPYFIDISCGLGEVTLE